MSNPINDGGPAFAMGYHPEGNSADHPGMTLRDWYKGQVVSGWCEAYHIEAMQYTDCSSYVERVARFSEEVADAMLRAKEVRS